MTDNLVELQKSYDTGEAQIIKSLLLSHNIYCEIFDSNANATLAIHNYTMGGARIMVLAEDYDKALRVIAEGAKTDDKE